MNKFRILTLLAALFLVPAAFATSNWGTYYATLTTKVANTGAGKVYATTNASGDNLGSYSDTESSATSSQYQFSADTSIEKLYAYARPNEGYRFLGWYSNNTAPANNGYDSFLLNWKTSLKGSKNQGEKTYTYYAHFSQITPSEIHLCVGDTLTLSYDVVGNATTGQYADYQAAGSGNVVSAEAVGTGASSNSKYRGCSLTIKAFDEGTATVKLQRRVNGDSAWGDYDIINVTVSGERRLKRGESVELSCVCSSVGAGNATWTGPTSSDASIVSAPRYASQSASESKLVVKGVESGTATVTAGNRTGSANTAYSGAEYVFAVEVLPTPSIPVSMSPGSTLVVNAHYDDGVASTVYALDQKSSAGVTAAVSKNGNTDCQIRLDAAETATVGDTARFTVKAGEDLFLEYNVTIVAALNGKVGDSFADLVPKSSSDWKTGTSDDTVAVITPTGTAINRTAKIDTLSLGVANCWATNVTASLGYHAYKVKVTGTHEQTVVVACAETREVVCGLAGTQATTWTAASAAPTTAAVAMGDEPEQGQVAVRITGVSVGETTVTVANDYFTETIHVRVVSSLISDSFEIGIDETKSVSENFGRVNAVRSDNELAATAAMEGGVLKITGHADGTAVITVESENFTAVYTVLVHEKDIRKTVELALGASGGTSYSYTFDSVESVGTPDVAGIVSIVRDGATVTFTATGVGTTHVDVACHVDGLTDSSTLHYTFIVTDMGNRGVWQYGDAYVIYENVSDIREVGDDLLLTFTDSNTPGTFEIPAPYVATANALAIGGGGAGGGMKDDFGRGGGGGGAGGYVETSGKLFQDGVYTVTVGKGGVNPADGAAAAGVSGEDSTVVNQLGVSYLDAAGGGGGGTGCGRMASCGVHGGSGGGGSWFEGIAGTGGTGMDGHGASGAMPSDDIYNCGAGGGGAGGVGAVTGAGGSGKANAITGTSVIYSAGGAGGVSDRTAAGAPGAGVGFGGAGGSGARGGAGADGAVYVRITKLQRNIKVPVPTTNDLLTLRFQWENNTVCRPFDYSGKTFRSPTDMHPYIWDDVIASVEGTEEVVCTTGSGGAKVGIGYYSIVITLKDGYAWDTDGDSESAGSTEPLRFRWNVVEDPNAIIAELDASKFVSWQNDAQATIAISSYTSPEQTGGVVKSYSLDISDQVQDAAAGLDLKAVTVKVSLDGTTYSTYATWTAGGRVSYPDEGRTGLSGTLSVDAATSSIAFAARNLSHALWTRLEISVEDNGIFRTNIGATYNARTGLYEKNPNKGSAQVAMTDADGNVKVVTCEAETEIPWRYVAHPVEVYAVNGSIYVNGTEYNPYAMYEGADVTVYYRGKGGYELKQILVDDMPIAITDDNLDHYTISSISAPHSVVVQYERFYGNVSSTPISRTYDGKAHVFPVTLTGWTGDYKTQVRFALELNAPDDEYYTEEEFCAKFRSTMKNVGVHRFSYRVYAYQPGYGETLTQPGWAWVDTGRQGTSTVTITPLDLTVEPKYVLLTAKSDFSSNGWTNVTDFVEGEGWSDISTTGWGVAADDYTALPSKDRQEGLYPTKMTGVIDGSANGNYTIRIREGILAVIKRAILIDDIPQGDHINPEDPYGVTGVAPVEKVYDGVAVGLTINVTDPDSTAEYKLYYRNGDAGSYTQTPVMVTDVGKHKIWYRVEPTSTGTYIPVTNYQYVTIAKRPITIRSESATKAFDGTALTAPRFTVVEGSLVDGDEITCTYTGGQTAVGSSDNTFTYAFTQGKESNYEVTVEYGTLTVTPAPITINGVTQPLDSRRPLDQGKTGVNDIVKEYDGVPTNLVVQVENVATPYTVKFTTNRSDPDSWKTDLGLVDVGEYVVYYAVEAEGYASVTNFGRVTIKVANVTSVEIVDHCDAGGGKIHLAFKLTTLEPLTAEYVRSLAANGRIKVVAGGSESALATAVPFVVPLRDPTGALDVDKGWIWITIDPGAGAVRPSHWKAVID